MLEMNEQRRRLGPAGRGSIRAGGFTLVEMLVTLTVLGIMMGVAIPSFKSFVEGQKVKTAAFDLTSALLLARSEAIKRNAAVTITPDTADTWIAGWTVAVGGTTLHKQQALSGVTITKAASASVIPPNFAYGSNGRLSSASETQYLQVNGGNTVKCLRVDLTGIPSTATAACP